MDAQPSINQYECHIEMKWSSWPMMFAASQEVHRAANLYLEPSQGSQFPFANGLLLFAAAWFSMKRAENLSVGILQVSDFPKTT